MLGSNLSKILKDKYKKRSIVIRKGDSVKVMRGEFKGKTGKILSVNLRVLKVIIEGIQRGKKDGTKVNVIFDPSNLQVQELNLDDKKRIKMLTADKEQAKPKSEEAVNAQ